MNILEAVGRYFTTKRVGLHYYSTREHDSLILNTAKDTFNWYSRRKYGNIADFFFLMGDFVSAKEYKDANNFTITDFVALTNHHSLDSFEETFGYPGGSEYLRKRGILDSTAEAWQIEHMDDRIIFPTVNNKNERAFIVRFTDDTLVERYRNYGKLKLWPHPTAYGIALDSAYPILLFEGIFSVLRFWQVDNSIQAFASLTNKYIFPLSVFASFQKIVIIPDNDAPGYLAADEAKAIRPDVQFVYPPAMPDELTDVQMLSILEKVRNLSW